MSDKRTKEASQTQRRLIVQLLNEGKTYTHIQQALGCSRNTIAKVKSAMVDPEQDPIEDGRTTNGKETTHTEEARQAVLAMRDDTGYGSLLIWAMMKRNPEKYGMSGIPLPSPATIGRMLADANLTTQPTGSKDRRFYPYEQANGTGDLLIMDGWGPHHITKSQKVYMTTIKDAYSRMFLGCTSITTSTSADTNQWISAYYMAVQHMFGGEPPAVLQTDNGIGLAIAHGHTPQTARHALRSGSRLVYIPKAQPWRNGKLENNHWRMEKEFWRRPETEALTTTPDILGALAEWLNFYNMERPQTMSKRLRYPFERAANPGEGHRAGAYLPVEPDHLKSQKHDTLEPQTGILDVVRLVENQGYVDLWAGDWTRLQEILQGQYVRLRFYLDPAAQNQYGEVIWRSNHEGEPTIIATFNHSVDRPRNRKAPVISAIQYHDFDRDIIANAGFNVDQVQLDNQIARITKRPHRTGGDKSNV